VPQGVANFARCRSDFGNIRFQGRFPEVGPQGVPDGFAISDERCVQGAQLGLAFSSRRAGYGVLVLALALKEYVQARVPGVGMKRSGVHLFLSFWQWMSKTANFLARGVCQRKAFYVLFKPDFFSGEKRSETFWAVK
jgi:hypothetical protein